MLGFFAGPFVIHVQIGLAHLAGNHDSPGPYAVRHINKSTHEPQFNMLQGKGLGGAAAICFVGPGNSRAAQIRDDAIQGLGIFKIRCFSDFRRSAGHAPVITNNLQSLERLLDFSSHCFKHLLGGKKIGQIPDRWN